jgi:dolichyl-phosphate-mannose--protein O-mannosyl transferase
VNGYLQRELTFNGHPPIGVQLIAFAAQIGGYDGSTAFNNNNDPFTNPTPLRFLPALAGSLIPVAAYVLALTLGASPFAALFAGILLIFDNALLVQSKFVLLDVFLVLFGFMGLIFFVWAKKHEFSNWRLALSGIFMGLAVGVKWSSIGFLIVPPTMLVWCGGREFIAGRVSNALAFVRKAALWFAILPLCVYILAFTVQIALASRPGPVDNLLPANWRQESLTARIWDLQKIIYSRLVLQTDTHPYSSKWYSWPFMVQPVSYWENAYGVDFDHVTHKPIVTNGAWIFLLGNPLVWWGSTLGLILAFFFWKPKYKWVKWFLYGGYVAYLFPFVFVSRTTFLYHYFPGLIFAVMITIMWLFESLQSARDRKALGWMLALALAVILVFVFYAPLSYGTPLTSDQYNQRMLLDSWKAKFTDFSKVF